ncbi:uncharacterized protein LOC122540542 [Chiloscyllium plagiosum]|uniref:uncharacterized protein LOC122540542 n=1 Tax=Chiloscyllium plagiosum TaxID=36176 RepID=UPI001CB7E18D|nr:uncharacterized protein LOC122540542 [Chiloscyllium plagiosum]
MTSTKGGVQSIIEILTLSGRRVYVTDGWQQRIAFLSSNGTEGDASLHFMALAVNDSGIYDCKVKVEGQIYQTACNLTVQARCSHPEQEYVGDTDHETEYSLRTDNLKSQIIEHFLVAKLLLNNFSEGKQFCKNFDYPNLAQPTTKVNPTTENDYPNLALPTTKVNPITGKGTDSPESDRTYIFLWIMINRVAIFIGIIIFLLLVQYLIQRIKMCTQVEHSSVWQLVNPGKRATQVISQSA